MSVPDLPIDRTIRHRTDDVFSSVGEPVRSASLFYALYYLVEVEGIAEAAFDFKQVRERSARGFYWYGLVTTTAELSHLHDRYFIDGRSASLDQSEPEPLVVEHIHRDLFPEGHPAPGDTTETLAERAETAFAVIPEVWQIDEPAAFENALRTLQSDFDAVGDPQSYLAFLDELMDAMQIAGTDPQIIKEEGLTGWAANYNGPAWEGIVEHCLRREDLSDTAFVDVAWSIEHNNRRWIDKIGLMLDETQNEAVVEELGLRGFDDPRAQKVNPPDVDKAVTDILDAARDGPTSRLFKWAEHFQADVDVNLRRWRQRLNIR